MLLSGDLQLPPGLSSSSFPAILQVSTSQQACASYQAISPAVLPQHCSKKMINDRKEREHRACYSPVERDVLNTAFLAGCCWRLLSSLGNVALSSPMALCPCHLHFHQWLCLCSCPHLPGQPGENRSGHTHTPRAAGELWVHQHTVVNPNLLRGHPEPQSVCSHGWEQGAEGGRAGWLFWRAAPCTGQLVVPEEPTPCTQSAASST